MTTKAELRNDIDIFINDLIGYESLLEEIVKVSTGEDKVKIEALITAYRNAYHLVPVSEW